MQRISVMLAFVGVAAVAFLAGHGNLAPSAEAQAGKLTALDYQEIRSWSTATRTASIPARTTVTTTRTCSPRTACSSTTTPTRATRAGGRVLAKGRDALATLVGGGERGCKTKLVWTDWSHLMLNHEITPTAEGAKGRVYLVQLGMNGPGTVTRHGGYEDIYVRTPEGWRIKQRMHMRNKAWHAEALRTPDLN